MKRASESSSSYEGSIEKKSRTTENISNSISGGVNLESLHMPGSSIGNALELQSECTVELVNADDGAQIIQDDDSLAGETSLSVLVEYMDITEPLTTLRALLEQRTGVNLSEYHFYLQDSQELEASKNLVNQCVQGEGLVQINVVISDTGGTKKINIVDVLKPAEEISLSPSVSDEVSARIFLLGDTTFVESTGHQQKGKVTSPTDPQQVTRWIIAPQFRKLQERHKIPNDPSNWSEEHVRIWLEWSTHHFKIQNVDLSDWIFTGKELISMSQQSFKSKIPVDPGDLFWTHVELLRKFKIVAIIQQPFVPGIPHSEEEKVLRSKRTPRIGPSKNSFEGSQGNQTSLAADFVYKGHAIGNNGQIQLWQFLLELLTDKDFRDFIQWVGNDGEFKLMNPEMVAQLWGQRKNKPTMNYEKLSRALRYYYDGEMLAKVHGKRFVYKFVCDLKSLLGYDAFELNRLVTECEMKRTENFHHGAVLAFQTIDSNSGS